MSDLHPSPSAEAGPPKTLRWFDGFMLAVRIANGLFISVGYAIGAIGALPAVAACAPLSVVWPEPLLSALEKVCDGRPDVTLHTERFAAPKRDESGNTSSTSCWRAAETSSAFPPTSRS